MTAQVDTVSLRPALGRPVLVGTLAILAFFGGLGGWAATAPLSAAAHATGHVRVESYRKTVQHLEGGIVSEILVRDGDVVRAGQILVRMADVQSNTNVSMLQAQIDTLVVLRARVLAERDDLATIRLPPEISDRLLNPAIAQLVDSEDRLFQSRRARQIGKIDVLNQRVAQLGSEIASYRAQVTAVEAQTAIVVEQITVAENLVGQGLNTRASLLSLQKELAQLEGQKGQQQAMLARAEQTIGEAQLEMIEVGNARLEEASTTLRDAEAQLQQIQDRLLAASDVQQRTSVVAPQAGRVMSLRQVTIGGVIRPGDPILDIVPDDGHFIIEVSISPYDIDNVRVGFEAEVKLAAFQQRMLPILLGTVRSISADALSDQRTGASYYTAEVVLPEDQLAVLDGLELYPGMPADVMIKTSERTVLQYLTGPITDSFRRALREQ